MKTILIITLIAFGIIVYCLCYVMVQAKNKFVAKYNKETFKNIRHNSTKGIQLLDPKCIMFICPFINIIFAVCYVFTIDKLIDMEYKTMEDKYLELLSDEIIKR